VQQGAIDFSCDVNTLVVAPSAHVQARETSALAAVQAQPYRTKANAELLALISAAGLDGMSDAEIQQATGLSRQTICLRRFDLRAFLTPATRRAKSPAGRAMVCWRRRTAQEMVSE
jgi:hypothetical protein